MSAPNDIALLRSIRGRFRASRGERWLPRLFAVLFCVITPGLLVYALFQFGVPRPPFSADQWTCIVMAPVSFALGVFLWCTADVEYEFTGDEILYRRAGSVRWRLPIASITDTRVETLQDRTRVWHLRAGSVSRAVVVVRPLAEHLAALNRT